MMMEIIRIISLVIGLLSLYMTHLYFKRNTFNRAEFFIWGLTWLGLIVISAGPAFIYSPLKLFNVDVVNFIYVVSFLMIYILCFQLYVKSKLLNEKVEAVVREMALKGAGIEK